MDFLDSIQTKVIQDAILRPKPKYLYKYHQLNIHLMEMLTNANFHMSKKIDLNDPLDSAYTLSLENYLNIYCEKNPAFKGDEKHLELLTSIFNYKIQDSETDWLNDLDEISGNLRVSCFTEDANNMLMWSHYSNNHTGVCLKFEPSFDPIFEKAVLPVSYTEKLLDIKNLSDFPKCLLNKLKVWETEREWRIISNKEKFPFKQETLVEIVLGLKVPHSTTRWFEQFVENVYYMHATISKLEIKGNKLVKVDRYGDEITGEVDRIKYNFPDIQL